MSKRVIIIGAGPGGLASAMLLAHAGLQVDVVEKQPVVGGRTSHLQQGDFTFDLGPTFFLYPQVLEQIFAAVGRQMHHEIELIRLDPQYRLLFGDGSEIMATPDLAKLKQEVARIAPADAEQIERFMSENREKLHRFKPCLESAFLSWRDVLQPRLLKLLGMIRPWASLDSELRRYFADPRIRLAFSFQSKYLGMSPFKCPSLFSILSFLEYEHGVFHPRGGCAAVTAAMARVAQDLGVRIHLNQPVREVLVEGGQAVGVRTDAGEMRCDCLVINADFAHAMTHLVAEPVRRKWTNRYISTRKYSCSTFMLYLGIEGKVDVPHHTIYMDSDYQGNLRDIEQDHLLSQRHSMYVQNACVTDPALAPPGHSTLYVLAPVTHMHPNVDWATQRQAFRQQVLGQLPSLGIHDVEKRIRVEHCITPADWQDHYSIYRGATFNLAHNLGQMLHFRPHNRFEDVQGVYLVGGGTHPGSGLPVIFESARISSRLLLQDLGLRLPQGYDPLAKPVSESVTVHSPTVPIPVESGR